MKTDLYKKLKKQEFYKYEYIYNIERYVNNPKPFTLVASEHCPLGKYDPTPVHYFIKLLSDMGKLLRNYTQNTDALETIVGIPKEKLVEAFGSYSSATCLGCTETYDLKYLQGFYSKKEVAICNKCNGLVKPDIVFFGEELNERYFRFVKEDFPKCDLFIVIGNDLDIEPLNRLVDKNPNCPRVLMHLDKVYSTFSYRGFHFDRKLRDVILLGDVQSLVCEIARNMGYGHDLMKLIPKNNRVLKLLQTTGTDKTERLILFPEPLFDSFDIKGLAEEIKRSKNIVVMTGAGISTACGIPDFRSPKTGLYANLQKFNLEKPEHMFSIEYFIKDPLPFTCFAEELCPSGKYDPTPVHYFIRLLQQKKILLRNYTQNIDTLERIAGIPEEYLVEAHGSFASAHCLNCGKEYPMDFLRQLYKKQEIPICSECKGLVKPDIVFFGEDLPQKYHDYRSMDFPKCDLLIVIGSSLVVEPFCLLVDKNKACPRALINRESVYDTFSFKGFHFDEKLRDLCLLGDCQEIILKLVKELGWDEEFKEIIPNENRVIKKYIKNEKDCLLQ